MATIQELKPKKKKQPESNEMIIMIQQFTGLFVEKMK